MSLFLWEKLAHFSHRSRRKCSFFCFDYFICNPLHAARRAMAAAPSCSSSRPQLNYPPVYPFPTPGPACAVIVGVSPRSPSPHIRQIKRENKKPPTNRNRLFNPARPPTGTGPEPHLTSISLLHRREPPKSHPREEPWPLALTVSTAISHRTAPVLPTPRKFSYVLVQTSTRPILNLID